MKIEKNTIDELSAELTLIIEKDDYLDDYKKQLKSTQQKAQMKGFRKGKTPMSVIQKMYGNSILQESVSKLITDKINELITGDEYNIIGEPFLLDRENLPEIEAKNPTDYTYKFEIGLEPDFDVKGIAESDIYTKYDVTISDAMIDDEINSLLKRLGEQKSVEGPVEDDDVVYFIAKELKDGKVLEGGHSMEFSSSIDSINEPHNKALRSLKVGGIINADIYEFEKDLAADKVEKYLLKVEEDADISEMGSDFQLEIKDIVRVEKASLDQDVFDKSFGKDQVKSEEEARTKIKEFLTDHFEKESNNLVNREIMEKVMEINTVPLPENFLKKWMGQNKEEEMTDEQFDSFKKELKWRIIKKKLVKQFEVEVKEEEIFRYFVDTIRSYSPYIDEESLKNTAFSLMNNKEQVNSAVETISSGKLFDKVREVIQTNSEAVDKEGFNEIVKSINQKAK